MRVGKILLVGAIAGSAACGRAWAVTDDFIVDGLLSESGQWPWQVRLLRTMDDELGFCGGSLIAPQWVLTAAHCLVGRSSLAVGYGAVNLKDLERIDVEAIHLHPSYGLPAVPVDATMEEKARSADAVATHPRAAQSLVTTTSRMAPTSDIGLIKLAEPLHGMPILRIADTGTDTKLNKPGVDATVIGWGATYDFKYEKALNALYEKLDSEAVAGFFDSPKLKYALELRHADIKVVTHSACREDYRTVASSASHFVIDDTEICAGIPGKVRDSCYGDSGGPLIVRDETGEAIQIGVVSWGYQCGHPGFPGVYARIASFHDWLRETIDSN